MELYLIITGYYTAKHYDKQKNDHKLKDSISYTIEKFLPIVPYIFIVTILQYTTNGIINIVNNGVSLRDVLYSSLENFTFDMLLVSETYTTPLVGSLWYLSAMFIIFPLFSYFMQFKNRYWIFYISYLYPIFYYGITNATGIRDFPHDFLRIIAGLCLGAFVYEFLYIFNDYINKVNRLFLTIVEVCLFAFNLLLTYKNIDMRKLAILFFVVFMAIVASQRSFTSNIIKGKFIGYLGRLSMPIYVFHWYIGSLLPLFGFSNSTKLLLFYALTILISVITMYLIENSKCYQRALSKPIKLR